MAVTYAILNSSFNEVIYNDARVQGIKETSYSSVRFNLAGTQSIVKWDGTRPNALVPYIVSEKTHAEMRTFLADNQVTWAGDFS